MMLFVKGLYWACATIVILSKKRILAMKGRFLLKQKDLNKLLWSATIIMAVTAVSNFPSIASIIMIIFVAMAVPVEPVKNFWKSKNLYGATKGILLVVLFCTSFGILAAGQKNEAPPPAEREVQAANDELEMRSVSDPTEGNADLTEMNKSGATEDNTLIPKAEPIVESEPTETISPIEEISDSEQADISEEDIKEPEAGEGESTQEETEIVTYILNTGTMKFHRPRCSSVSDIKSSNRVDFGGTKDEVIAKGYTACKRCDP